MRVLSSLVLLLLCACPNRDDPGDTPSDTGTASDRLCEAHAGDTVCDGDLVVTCDAGGQTASTVACDAGTSCEGGECVPCTPSSYSVPSADPAIVAARGLHLDIDAAPDGGQRLPYLRPVDLLAASTVSVSGPVELYDAAGAPLTSGAQVAAGSRVLLRATDLGAASLAIDDGLCAAQLALVADPPSPLVGAPLDGFPWFETTEVFVAEDDDVSLFVDPTRYFDRVGAPFDAHVVRAQDPAAWLADPTIVPVASVVGAVNADAAASVLLWSDPDPGALTDQWSVVVDFDRDGLVGPGDLVEGWDEPGFTVVGELSAPGPYTPLHAEQSYDFWHTFLAYWPEELDQLDPLPLVVISHGNGHDYTWYDYLGNHLASHGYAVIVHRNDTGDTSIIPAANSTWENTDLFLGDLANELNGTLDGEIDPHRIAFIGHSRGGEGVVIAYNGLVTGRITPDNFTAKDVLLVSSIAPTVWTSPETADPSDVIYHQLDGSSDGDVTGGTGDPIGQYFRLFQGATNTHALTYVQGATHNDFNCCGFDDGYGIGGPKIGRSAAQQIAKSYYLALLRAVFDADTEMWDFFARNPERFRPAGVETPVTTLLFAADDVEKWVIDDFEANPSTATASSGEVVSFSAENLAEGALMDGNGLTAYYPGTDPFNGMTWVLQGDSRPDHGMVLEWSEGSDLAWEVAVPESRADWRGHAALTLRVAQGTRHPYTLALDDLLSFTIEVEDADGNTSGVDFRVYGGVNEPYQRDLSGLGVGWVNEFQTVRIPVTAFAADGTEIDLSRIAALRFRFGAAHGSAQGRVGIDDIELLKEVLP